MAYMQQDKVKIELGGISASMFFPLWGRAQLSKKYSSLFYDAKAIELVEKIDYDFSTSGIPFQDILSNISFEGGLPLLSLFSLRAKQFDEKVKAYIRERPRASVVNIGAGLDTTFYHVDNGTIHWYDLDLPAVIDVRRQLLPEPERVTYIAKSLLDPSWCKDINTDNGVFMVAGGVLSWLEEAEVKQFFSMLTDNFPDGEIVFDFRSRSDDSVDAWVDIVPPEQRGAVRAAWAEGLKTWWKKAPQDQKDKLLKTWWKKAPQDQKDNLNDMIATLETPVNPKGKEWADIEAWWDQISDKEKGEAIVGLMMSARREVSKWTLEDASEFTKWDSRITVIDQVPTFRNVPRDSLSEDMRRFMDYSDESGRSTIIHLRV